MQTVKDILENKAIPFNTVNKNMLVIDALNLMNSINLSYLVVMDGDKYNGIFCERDYSRNVILKGRNSRNTLVEEVMTIDLPIVGLKDTLGTCMQLLNMHKTRYLLAYNNENLAGIITINDVLRQVMKDIYEADPHDLEDEKSKIY